MLRTIVKQLQLSILKYTTTTYTKTPNTFVGLIKIPNRLIVISPWPDVSVVGGNFVQQLFVNSNKFLDKTAIIDGIHGTSYRYSEVLQLVKRISSALHKQDIGKGDVICITMPNSPEYILAVAGILATGATVTFGNPIAKPEEMAFQLNNSQSKMIITSSALVPVIQKAASLGKSVRQIYVVGDCNEQNCRSFDELLNDDGRSSPYGQVEIDASNDISFLPYSSGTTGLPKGVMLTHENIIANLSQMIAIKDLKYCDERVLLVLPLFHIYGLMVVTMPALHTGGTVVTVPSFQPETFLNAISKYRISYLHLVPPLVLFLLQHPLVEKWDFSSVSRILCAAAPLDAEAQAACQERLKHSSPNIDIFQGYGLSETSPLTHIMPSRELRPKGKNKANSMGLLMPNLQAKVISQEGQELGANERGELVVKGPNIMKGYLNNQQATDNCIKDGWFHTGDIVLYDEDGYFYIVDRLKELIKYKGMQVAPAELEAILLSHPGIDDSAVVGKADERSGEVPVAFVVKNETGANLTEEEIVQFVSERVSDYKRLRGVRFVNSIPRSASGKIFRKNMRKLL